MECTAAQIVGDKIGVLINVMVSKGQALQVPKENCPSAGIKVVRQALWGEDRADQSQGCPKPW
jgi:hypothetical protein